MEVEFSGVHAFGSIAISLLTVNGLMAVWLPKVNAPDLSSVPKE